MTFRPLDALKSTVLVSPGLAVTVCESPTLGLKVTVIDSFQSVGRVLE